MRNPPPPTKQAITLVTYAEVDIFVDSLTIPDDFELEIDRNLPDFHQRRCNGEDLGQDFAKYLHQIQSFWIQKCEEGFHCQFDSLTVEERQLVIEILPKFFQCK